ncbi:TonB-dependent receptor domain-containing protein [Sphingobium indicum]|nr:TonB-dependent receptor [Sphingobium indicum]
MFARTGITAASAMLCLPTIAEARTEIAVPRQRLEKAIQQLALQSRRQVIFFPSSLTQQMSRPVAGRLSFEDALRRLLAGTGLTFRQGRGGVTSIEPAPQDVAPGDGGALSEDLPSRSVDLVVIGFQPTDLVALESDVQVRPTRLSLDGVMEGSAATNAQPGSSGQQGIVVRGIGTAGEATTVVYFGDVPISGPSGTGSDSARSTMDLAMVDIARVQISRTSRGTEHGMGALAGEVEVEPEAPRLGTWQATSTAGLSLLRGGDPGYQLSGTINAPIGASAAIRLTGYAHRAGGYVDNVRTGGRNLNDDALQGVRLIARARPLGDLDMSAMLVWQHRRIDDGAMWSRALGRYNTDRHFAAPTTHDFLLGRFKVEKGLGGARLTGISSFYRWRLDRNYDRTNPTLLQAQDPAACQRFFDLADTACDTGQVGAFADHVESLTPSLLHIPITLRRLSQEVRIESIGDQGLGWKAGALIDHRSERFTSGLSIYDGDDTTPPDYFGLRQLSIGRLQTSAFGDIGYREGGWQASLGLRYDRHRVSSRNDVLVPNIISGSIDSWPRTVKRSQGVHARAHLDIPISARATFHAQVTRSFRPAGVNIASVLLEDRRTFEGDSLWGVEVGAKLRWSPGLSLTLIGYMNTWHDMQYRALSENRSHAYIVNVGTVAIRGAELEMIARPSDGATIKLASSFIYSRLESVSDAGPLVGGAATGESIPFVSSHRSTLSVSQRWPLGGDRSFSTNANVQYQSGYWSTFNRRDPDFLATKGFVLMGVEGVYRADQSSVTASIRNLFNDRADLRALNNGFGIGQTLSARAREIVIAWTRQW